MVHISFHLFHNNGSYHTEVVILKHSITCFSSEQLITPEQFAEIMCGDLDLNPTTFTSAIAQTIRQQAEAYSNESLLDEQRDQRVILKVRDTGCRELTDV